ncbi:GntR family transcriptional regulator [Klebsiella pneumoniae]|uniref:GntR family transcriptional regulator n=1 Tax=Klebsiella pneumoniae TaxID=573 RepID=A0A378F5X3_KLEPN|nr:GntR family transcriptional regulator [Klebsiella pneumoniae]
MASFGKWIAMSARRFGTQSLVRLLGNWQETSSRTPLWRQLAEALRLLILDGRLTLQTRLPGERELAAALNVSRTTIASALGQLREEGFLYSRQGSGSRIVLPERPADLPLPAGISSTLNLSTAALSAGPEVHQAFQHAMTLLPPYLAQTGYDQQGLPVLREAIARRYSERGLPTRPDEVMVVNGALSAFALILRLFTGPGDRVVIDAPPIRWPSAPFRAPPAAPSGLRFRSRDGTAMDWRRLLRRLRRGWRG